jgi:hypothetical protein
MVQTLLCNFEGKQDILDTILSIALMRGHRETAKYVISSGGTLKTTKYIKSILIRRRCTTVLEWVFSQGDSETFVFISEMYPLLGAPYLPNMRMLEIAGVNFTHENGSTKTLVAMFAANAKNSGSKPVQSDIDALRIKLKNFVGVNWFGFYTLIEKAVRPVKVMETN